LKGGRKTVKRYLVTILLLASLVLTFGLVGGAHAALIRIGPGDFTPLAPTITFSEVALGTVNPSYNLGVIPSLDPVNPFTVNFEGYFVGQSDSGGFPNTLSDSTPTSGVPLALDPAAPNTFTTNDGANPTSPVLSGIPQFNGVIAVLFSAPVAGVGLDGGYFDALNSTTIEAYGPLGQVLGSVTNASLGIEFFGLADSSLANTIQGISFYITGPEPAGFAIDNLTFGAADVIDTPEPGTLLLITTGLLGLVGFRRKFRK
jgi:hypothetical protein